MNCVETPLTDLLRSVPKNHRTEWETQWAEDGTPTGHAMCPIGKHCHEAADRIDILIQERNNLKTAVNDANFLLAAKRAVIEDGRRLTKELDQACFGKDAAQQASLCDLVKVIPAEMRRLKKEIEAMEIALLMFLEDYQIEDYWAEVEIAREELDIKHKLKGT